jgi:hypothetical protein
MSKAAGGNGNGGGGKAKLVWSRNMHLRVAAPEGNGWELMEAGPHGDGLLAAVRCMHGEPPNAVALNAYAYAVPEGQRKTVEQLAQQDWRGRALASTFESVSNVDVSTPTRAGVARGCEVQLDGIGRDGQGPLRMRERWVPDGGRMLVLTAAASPELFVAYAMVIEVWLTTSSLGAGR